MRKFSFLLIKSAFLFSLLAVGLFPVDRQSAAAEGRSVYICGKTAGFLLNMGGVQVIALSEVFTENGTFSPAKEGGLLAGDVISSVNGKEIAGIEELNGELSRCNGKTLTLGIKRNKENKNLTVSPKKDKTSDKFKLGIIIRDTVSGIGTVTYIDRQEGRFGALGHGVYNGENELLSIGEKRVFGCDILSVNKGIRGKAGELKGIFTGDGGIGVADKITDSGLYGKADDNVDLSDCKKTEIAPLSEAHIGAAYIYSTVSGYQPIEYKISIVKVDPFQRENKNFVVKIDDDSLIEKTGGIVQGMSGSPIVQDGKLIGALTHVFLNDPTRGYGIGIENMLGN